VNFAFTETTERVFRKVWEMACQSGFLAGREAAQLMLPRAKGAIFFTGATASLRGGIGYAAFAAAKAGLRALAQSAARELGPKNIHSSEAARFRPRRAKRCLSQALVGCIQKLPIRQSRNRGCLKLGENLLGRRSHPDPSGVSSRQRPQQGSPPVCVAHGPRTPPALVPGS
jgi:Enoyl-(Acyl carrier protein) reductase